MSESKRTKKTERTEAAMAYEERRARNEELLGQIDDALEKHASEMEAQPRNWGFAGDLGHVSEGLAEIVKFLSGGTGR